MKTTAMLVSPPRSKSPVRSDEIAIPSALYLTEVFTDMNKGAGFLDGLALEEARAVRRAAISINVAAGESVFRQGEPHKGIHLIESGRVRTYYIGPSGREMTLAYWTPGHFIGGPEVFGGGAHVWSAVAVDDARLSFLSAAALRHLVQGIPAFAMCIIDAMAAKGKCYSALVQMLGTRSVVERLAQLLLIMARLDGRTDDAGLLIDRKITHEQIASIVGSTRQWVTMTLKRFENGGLIQIKRNTIVLLKPNELCNQL